MKEPPHNLSAEAAVIGSIIYDNNAYGRVSSFLTPEDFYAPAHQLVYATIQDLLRESRVADGITLRERFEKDETLTEIGGPQYLGELLDSAAFGMEVNDYGRIISDLSVRRKLSALGDKIVESTVDYKQRAEDIIQECENDFGALHDSLAAHRPAISTADDVDNALFYPETEDLLKTGYPTLDAELGGFERGAHSILAGSTGMGKSALNICLMAHIAERETVGLISLDMSRRVVNQRLACYMLWQTGERTPTFRQIKEREIDAQKREALANVLRSDKGRNILVDERGGLSTADINAQIRSWKAYCKRQGLPPLGAVFVDHIGKVYPRQKSGGLYEKTSYVSNELLEVAKQHPRVALISLAQINRDGPKLRRRPRASDLRDSGKIEEDASAIILVHREEWHLEQDAKNDALPQEERAEAQKKLIQHRGVMEVIIGKNRNGSTGAVTLKHSIAHNVVRDPTWEQGRAAA